jgi:carboxypeptidase Taq
MDIMNKKLKELKDILAEVADLVGAQAVLSWDQQTYMPAGGAESRGEQLSTLARITHDKFTSPRIGELLDGLSRTASLQDPSSDDARLVKVTSREYAKQTKISSEWVTEYAQATAMAQDAWVAARTESNFNKFQPHLEKVVDLKRKYAEFFAPYDHVYDPLLDDYEPGLKTKEVKDIFLRLREEQVKLIKMISQKPQVDDSFIMKDYSESKQWDFGVEVITRFGYDWQNGRQDKAAHPFTTTFGYGDIRITTRFLHNNGVSSLFSSMHEAGHGMYEQGISEKLRRSLLFTGASMAIHESQSRMFENLVGRSLEFWTFFYPRYQALMSEHLANVPLEKFYRGINKVEPSLVRVEADEATYNLHIMLRLELEIALMEGKLAVKDLPDAWNAKMKDYLGITPPNDAKGVLQDIHWSSGYIGYFPTYALGNLVSAQLWEKILEDIPALPSNIRSGEFSQLLGWLREKVHQHGAKYDPQEMVQKITGSKITPEPYLRYLKKKYTDIYNL